jgi:hypothetical protein
MALTAAYAPDVADTIRPASGVQHAKITTFYVDKLLNGRSSIRPSVHGAIFESGKVA